MQRTSNQAAGDTIPCDWTPSLPEWIIVPILACLVAISGVIVLVGWLVMKPVAVPAVRSMTYDSNFVGGAVAKTKSPFVAEKIPLPEDEPVCRHRDAFASGDSPASPDTITSRGSPIASRHGVTPADGGRFADDAGSRHKS